MLQKLKVTQRKRERGKKAAIHTEIIKKMTNIRP